MQYFVDVHQRQIRLTSELLNHIESNHPEMRQQLPKIKEALKTPDVIIAPRFDSSLELNYKHYNTIPVTQKYICVVVKVSQDDLFVITAYFTDSFKKGEILWEIPPHEK
ncbi:MAG TPA: PBECR2 nuclease fold domain-containing protein [Candidatus Lokiarchaeia archaeon]|nr:PBECR2 nuclease fold domain-containing protein [Candidatus Lokiarchaeia archaeon]